jgi:hypothetical protein
MKTVTAAALAFLIATPTTAESVWETTPMGWEVDYSMAAGYRATVTGLGVKLTISEDSSGWLIIVQLPEGTMDAGLDMADMAAVANPHGKEPYAIPVTSEKDTFFILHRGHRETSLGSDEGGTGDQRIRDDQSA